MVLGIKGKTGALADLLVYRVHVGEHAAAEAGGLHTG